MGWMLDGLIDALARAVLAVINTLWGLLSQSIFQTPDVTKIPQVAAITSKTTMVVNTGFILAILAAGIVVMTHQTVQVRYGVGDLAPRLVLGFVAANFAVPLCSGLVQGANALTQALTGDGVASWNSFQHLQVVVTEAMSNPANGFLAAVIGLLICVLTGMLLVGWIVRLGLLVVLVGLSPLALACHASPFTDGAARLWWRAMLGTLATVMLQALALQTTLSIFLNPAANLAPLGIVHDPNGTFNLFLVTCLLWIIVKIPELMRRYVTRGGGQRNIAGMILKMAVVQQVTGLLRLPFAGRGRARRATAAAAGVRGAGRAARGTVTARRPSVADTVIEYWRPRTLRPTPANRAAPAASRTTPAPTPAAAASGGGGGGGGGGSGPAGAVRRARAKASAGPNPATAMPQRRSAGTLPAATRSGTGWPDPPSSAPRLPAGARPSATGWTSRHTSPRPNPRYPATIRRQGDHSGR